MRSQLRIWATKRRWSEPFSDWKETALTQVEDVDN
jgi:hypothetical protein